MPETEQIKGSGAAAPPMTISERAARRVAEILAQGDTPDAKLRVAVHGGGCSGFQYGFDLDDKVEEGDLVIERDGAQVVIDSVSLMYLAGSELDYVEELAGSYFKLNNPNATSSCGCGASFGVAI